MDRIIIYPGQIPLETDLLQTNRNILSAMGLLMQDTFGATTKAVGFTVIPTGTPSMSVQVTPGRIYSLQNLDGSAYSSLPADTHQVLKQGILLDSVTVACPAPVTAGQSINYLIQVAFSEIDAKPVALPYYNANNPTQAYTGPNNSTATQPTLRQGSVAVQAKAGTAAATGTQTTPAADAGFVGIYVVTVANGTSSITAGLIAATSGLSELGAGSILPLAPSISNSLPLTPFAFMTAAQRADVLAGTMLQDVSVPMQAWFDACGTGSYGGGRKGYWPAGKYYCTQKLLLKSAYVTIEGEGMAQTQLIGPGIVANTGLQYFKGILRNFSIDNTSFAVTTSITATIDNGSGASGQVLTVTVGSGLAVGSVITVGAGWGTTIVALGTGTGGTGTYTVSLPQLVASTAMTVVTGPVALDFSPVTGVVYTGGISDLYLNSVSCAMVAYLIFSTGLRNIVGSSMIDHTFKLNLSNTCTPENLYASNAGKGKAGFRLAGGGYLKSCNGLDNGATNYTVAASIDNGSGSAGTVLTVTAGSGLEVGSAITVGASVGTIITALGTGTGGVGTYTVNNSQLVASRSMTVQTSNHNWWCIAGVQSTGTMGYNSDFPGTTTAFASLFLENCNQEYFGQGGTLIDCNWLAVKIEGGGINRSAVSTTYNAFIQLNNQAVTTGSYVDLNPTTWLLGSGIANGGAALTGALIYNKAGGNVILDRAGRVPQVYDANYSSLIPTAQFLAVHDIFGDSAVQVNALKPRRLSVQMLRYDTPTALTPVGAAQAINVTGYTKVTVTPAAAASISTATFTSTTSAGLDFGRNGDLYIEAGNGNLTVNHTASGANTFRLKGAANINLATGQHLHFIWSTVSSQWIET